jgi:hypothetical protein
LKTVEGDEVLRIHHPSPTGADKDEDCKRYHWPCICATCRQRKELRDLPWRVGEDIEDICKGETMSVSQKQFIAAREAMADKLKDPDLRLAYVSNIAMCMHDELHERGYRPKLKHDDRNQIAERLLELIFD